MGFHFFHPDFYFLFFFQAEDGIRDLVRSRGLGDVYKRQRSYLAHSAPASRIVDFGGLPIFANAKDTYVCIPVLHKGESPQDVEICRVDSCLLYTSDAADERSSVDLGGRRIIKKKT